MKKVGADLIVAHMNTTVGGTIGAETAFTLEDAAVRDSRDMRCSKVTES